MSKTINIDVTRKRAATVLIAIAIIIAGCSGVEDQSASSDELEKNVGENLKNVNFGDSWLFETKKTEKNQKGLVQVQPPEGMDRSLERQNLKQRNQYLNDQNNQHYVYLLSHGKVVTWYIAQGKVSSVNSKLTNDKQVVRIPDCDEHNSGNDCWKVVESPQMDGSYGTNGDAIFFFTTDKKYVQWNGQYIVSEQPLNIQTPVELTQKVGNGGNSSGPTSADDSPNAE